MIFPHTTHPVKAKIMHLTISYKHITRDERFITIRSKQGRTYIKKPGNEFRAVT